MYYKYYDGNMIPHVQLLINPIINYSKVEFIKLIIIILLKNLNNINIHVTNLITIIAHVITPVYIIVNIISNNLFIKVH